MKILIISDTHRSLKTLKEVLRREEPIDIWEMWRGRWQISGRW